MTEEEPNSEDGGSQSPSTDSTLPPLPTTPPIFDFRKDFRNIYVNPITNSSTIPPIRDNNNKSESESPPLQPKWDEFCIQWCKQKDLNRDKSITPECKMLCFRRINNQFKKLNHHNEHGVIDYKANNGGEGKAELKAPRNFLDGCYLYYIKGLEICQKHTEGMKNETLNRSALIQNNPEEYEIDLCEKFEQTKSETKRIIERAFTPSYQFAKRYLESWSDGTQSSFFKRFYESVHRMDAVHIMQDNVKKAVEVWVDGGDDHNDGGIGEESNENSGGDNINRNDKNSSVERNEKD